MNNIKKYDEFLNEEFDISLISLSGIILVLFLYNSGLTTKFVNFLINGGIKKLYKNIRITLTFKKHFNVIKKIDDKFKNDVVIKNFLNVYTSMSVEERRVELDKIIIYMLKNCTKKQKHIIKLITDEIMEETDDMLY